MKLVLPCWELLLHSSSPVGASPRVSWVGPGGLAPGHEWALGGQLLGRGVVGLLAALGLPECGLGLCCEEVAGAGEGSTGSQVQF